MSDGKKSKTGTDPETGNGNEARPLARGKGRRRGRTPTPHDALFRALLEKPEQAQALLRDHLPNDIVGKLSDRPPVIHDRSFIDEELGLNQVDLLLEIETITGDPALVYLLGEFKSHSDPGVVLQLIRYMTLIWEYHAGNSPRKMRSLPPIIPLVLYSGQSNWTVPDGLREMIACDDPDLVFMPGERFIVRLLAQMGVDELSSDELLRVGFVTLTLRALECMDLLAEALAARPVLQKQVIAYIFDTYPEADAEGLRTGFRDLGADEMEAVVMTIAETLKAQGRAEGEAHGIAKGRAEGEAKGKSEGLIRLLERRFGVLSDADRERIEGADLDQFDAWIDRLLDAESVEAVFGEKKV